jgi:hypothetical protein
MSQQNLAIGDVEEKQVTRLIEVRLDYAARAALHDESRDLLASMKALESAFDVKKSEFKAEYNTLEAKLHATIEKMTENQEVDCTQKTYFENNIVQIWNGEELIEERALTADERQLSIGDLHHGVVLDAEEKRREDYLASPDGADFEPMTDEEQREDIASVIRAEQNPMKPSLVN